MIDLDDPCTRNELIRLINYHRQYNISLLKKYLIEEQDALFYDAENKVFIFSKFLKKLEKEYLHKATSTLNL